MRYWVYQNSRVAGPFDRQELSALRGLTAETLVCPEHSGGMEEKDWASVGSIEELASMPARASAAGVLAPAGRDDAPQAASDFSGLFEPDKFSLDAPSEFFSVNEEIAGYETRQDHMLDRLADKDRQVQERDKAIEELRARILDLERRAGTAPSAEASPGIAAAPPHMADNASPESRQYGVAAAPPPNEPILKDAGAKAFTLGELLPGSAASAAVREGGPARSFVVPEASELPASSELPQASDFVPPNAPAEGTSISLQLRDPGAPPHIAGDAAAPPAMHVPAASSGGVGEGGSAAAVTGFFAAAHPDSPPPNALSAGGGVFETLPAELGANDPFERPKTTVFGPAGQSSESLVSLATPMPNPGMGDSQMFAPPPLNVPGGPAGGSSPGTFSAFSSETGAPPRMAGDAPPHMADNASPESRQYGVAAAPPQDEGEGFSPAVPPSEISESVSRGTPRKKTGGLFLSRTSTDSGSETVSGGARRAAVADSAANTRPARKQKGFIAAIIGGGACLGLLMYFFFRNPKQVSQMVNMEPGAKAASQSIPGAEEGASPSAGSPAGSAPLQSRQYGVTAPADFTEDPRIKALSLVKEHPLSSENTTIEKKLSYSYSTPSVDENWSAGAVSANEYLVYYRVVKKGESVRNAIPIANFGFEVDLTTGKVTGATPDAQKLLDSDTSSAGVAAGAGRTLVDPPSARRSKSSRRRSSKKKPRKISASRSPRRASNPAQLPLPGEDELKSAGRAGGFNNPGSNTLELN